MVKLKSLNEQIVDAINFHESLSVLGFKDDGLYDLVCPMVKSLHSDVVIEPLDVRLIEQLNKQEKDNDIFDFLGINDNLKKRFSSLLSQSKRVVFIVSNIAKFENPVQTIRIFDDLISAYQGKLNFIYLLEDVPLFIKLQKSLDSNSSFFENTFINPLEGAKEKQCLEQICKKKYGALKSAKKLNEIFESSFGHYELYKRLYKAEVTGNKESLDSYARRLTKSFGKDVLRILRKLVKNIELDPGEAEIIDAYKQLGFVREGEIVVPILKTYITKLTPKEEISLDKETGQIIVSNIERFSKSETRLLRTFLEHEGETLTKEELGEVIWGEQVDKKYSPWAIDQYIFRLRLKLDRLHLKGRIKTVHGKGYVFTN